MKTSELAGPLLDLWVAKAEGLNCVLERWMTVPPKPSACWLLEDGKRLPDFSAGPYEPSTDWAVGGPIIERERIDIEHDGEYWDAMIISKMATVGYQTGPTPLISAMRAYVASKFGKEVASRP